MRDELIEIVRRRTIPSPADSLVTWCARPSMPDALVPELRRRAGLVADWDTVLDLAEVHGLGPLLGTHLKAWVPDIPPRVARQFTALLLWNRRANAVLFRVLGDVIDALRDAGVEALVLKGPALVPLVYGDAGLRPITDLDLLVPAHQAVPAQRVLAGMGFAAQVPASAHGVRRRHHLPGATRMVEGVPVAVEIHRNGLHPDSGASLPYDGRAGQTMTVDLGARHIPTLAPPLMLWHLCRHMTAVRHPFRLIWAADIIGFADAFADRLDWDHLRRAHPFVLSSLALIHHVTPLPEQVRRRAGVVPGRVPSRVGEDYAGWPRASAFVWDGWRARAGFVKQTLAPPEWWLRLNYGVPGAWGRGQGTLRHVAALSASLWRRASDILPREDWEPGSARR